MYLLYIDDSGTCNLKNDDTYNINGGNSRCFVLGGILIKAHELNQIENKISNIKNNCFKNNLEEIKYSINNNILNCYSSCNQSIDKKCFKIKMAQFINSIDCTVFATMQDKYYTTTNSIVKSKDDVYRLCFEHSLKSVDSYLYNNNIKDDTIVFIDKKDTGDHRDTLIYKAYKDALSNTTIYKSFSNNIFAPNLNIVYSKYTTGAQLADFVAGSVWSFFENGENFEKQKLAKEITKIYSSKVYTYNDKKIGMSICRNFLI